jgi:hypothetical protein
MPAEDITYLSMCQITHRHQDATSDVQGLAWPESPGLGLAWQGLGLTQPQARPYSKACAWLGPGLAQALGFKVKLCQNGIYLFWIHLVCIRDV